MLVEHDHEKDVPVDTHSVSTYLPPYDERLRLFPPKYEREYRLDHRLSVDKWLRVGAVREPPLLTPIILLRALNSRSGNEETDEQEERQSTLGWNELTDGPIEIIDVPGNHFTIMAPPHVQVLAKELSGCLERALMHAKAEPFL